MSSCYCVQLRKAARSVSSIYDAALQPIGINIAQFSLLRNIGRQGPLSLTALGERMALDRSTIGRNVRVLERLGLVVLGAGRDQREAKVGLTAAGEARLRAGNPLWDDAQKLIETRLGASGTAQLETLLEAL